MTAKIQTFTFEGHYKESDDSGGRCDVVLAYNERQAKRIAALSMISDNEWDNPEWGRLDSYESLEDAYDKEIQIDSQWSDLNGTACPNCTSHNGVEVSQVEIGDPAGDEEFHPVYECATCGYRWIPLGRETSDTTPTEAELDEELDAWEAEHMQKEIEDEGT